MVKNRDIMKVTYNKPSSYGGTTLGNPTDETGIVYIDGDLIPHDKGKKHHRVKFPVQIVGKWKRMTGSELLYNMAN